VLRNIFKKCEACLEAGSEHFGLFYEIRLAAQIGKINYKIPVEAGFTYSKVAANSRSAEISGIV
jgi:hypothetical protein